MNLIKMRLRHFLLPVLLLTLHLSAFAQTAATEGPDMAAGLRSSGKIYVVVLVLATIFAGIIAFLIYLERRLSKLEREMRNPG
jgi:hypothetical protein